MTKSKQQSEIIKVMDMGLLPSKEKDVPVKFTLKEQDIPELNQFVKFVSEQKGEDYEEPEVLSAIVLSELKKNKKFRSWLKEQETAKVQPRQSEEL